MTEVEVKEETKTLVAKLVEIMNEVERIPKNGHNDFHGYDYALESDIKDVVRKKMAEKGLILVPNEKSRTQTNISGKKGAQQFVSLEIEYTVLDSESGERIQFSGFGDGADTGDKAVYKAKTGALKYALTNLFMIPTGDDPEADGKSLQPAYIDKDKVLYLEEAVQKVANASNRTPSYVIGQLKEQLNTGVSFEKYERPVFEAAVRQLDEWQKYYDEQNKNAGFGGNQNQATQNNQSNDFQWGAEQ